MPAAATSCRAASIRTPISNSPFMGTVSADDFEWGTKAALSGGTTMVVDFCIPNPGQSLLAAYQDWRRKAEGAACDYGFHMAVTWWDKQVFDEMETCVKTYGINTFKHFMAYKGALMVNDDELYNSFLRCAGLGAMPLVHAENGDVVWHLQQHYLGTGVTGPEGHAFSRPPAVEGEATNRAIMIADMAGCPVYIVHTSCRDAHEAIARARAAGQRVFGEPLIQHLVLDEERISQQGLGLCGAARDVAAVSRRRSIRRASGPACNRARCRSSPPIIAPSRPSKNGSAAAISPKSRTAPAALKTACRSCGPPASIPAG